MTKHDLKELAAMGAELGAAKAENEKLRGLLRELRDITSEYAWDADLEARVDAALSRQAEPSDTFTAVDMATAAAQGFRDGQAAVEQAPAQDGREAFEAYAKRRFPLADRRDSLGAYSREHRKTAREAWEAALECAAIRPAQAEPAAFGFDYSIQTRTATGTAQAEPATARDEWEAFGAWFKTLEAGLSFDGINALHMAKGAYWQGWQARATRPAQTEQQPVATLLVSEGDTSASYNVTSFRLDELSCVPVGAHDLYLAAPIAQTVPQPEQSGLMEAAQGALTEIQAALEDAYHNAYPECCGQAHLECCGSPVQAWSEADQKTMDRFTPHEKALRAALSAQGQSNGDS